MDVVSDWAAGQEVILRTPPLRHNGTPTDEKVTISRVARKYAYVVRYGREVAYDIETGRERIHRDALGGGAYAGQLFTPEGLAEHDRREAAVKRVQEVIRGYAWMNSLDADTLNQIADLIEGAS